MPNPIYIKDLDDRIVWVNRVFEDRFDVRLVDAQGEFASNPASDRNDDSVILIGKDGRPFHAAACLVPILDDGGIAIAHSVVLKECMPPHTNGALGNQGEDIYRIIADNTLDTIVLVDNNAVVRYVSPPIATISGYLPSDYEGMDAFDIIHPEDAFRVRESHAQALQTARPVDIEYRLRHANGTIVHVEARVKPVLDEYGTIRYVVAVVRDITERKKTKKLLQNILLWKSCWLTITGPSSKGPKC